MQLVLVLVATLSLLLLLVALLVRIRPNPISEITPFSNRYPSWRSSPMIPSSSKPLQLYGIYFLPPSLPARNTSGGLLVFGFDPFLIAFSILSYIVASRRCFLNAIFLLHISFPSFAARHGHCDTYLLTSLYLFRLSNVCINYR